MANSFDNTVSVISDRTDRVVATLPVGKFPVGSVYDSGRGEVFVSNNADNTVSVISDRTDRVVATLPAGNTPADMAYDPAAGNVFVVDGITSNVSIIPDSQIHQVSCSGFYCWLNHFL